MAEPKTRKTDASVADFIDAVADERQRADCRVLIRMMQKATKAKPAMWGPNIVGFGSSPVVYANGSTLDWPIIGFSPRKPSLSIYLMPGFDASAAALKKLGKVKTGKSCLYVKRLADVDVGVLDAMIVDSVKRVRQQARAR
ncbi:MAG: DUF1801 domain-containing protein [Planctomycetes bacterium]|nr:DUF1801 domain-containing protein [Planctomycetota bacterium]MCC7173293.1 DUF1801 domain-containing protein [Planctomycetota bacterium]